MSTCNLCHEIVADDEIMEHLRLFHPDEYGDGAIEPELVTPDDAEPGGREVARIIIVRRITDDDVLDHVEAIDPEGDDLPLTEALGMMRLAEDTLIRDRMGESD